MNILYIVPYVPSQIYVRPFNIIKQLASHDNSVIVLTTSSNENDKKSIQHLKQFCDKVIDFPLPKWRSFVNCLLAIPTFNPLQSVYCWHPSLTQFSLNLIEKNHIDVIHIEHLRGARYGLAIKEQNYRSNEKSQSIPIIWDSVDCITHLFRQSSKHSTRKINKFITRFELGRTAKYEARIIKEFDHILVTSQTDKDALLSLLNSTEKSPYISVLPNGVDLDYFHPNNDVSREKETLVISGKMSYHANVTMVTFLINEIMPIVWSQKPAVQVWIVGKDPPQSILSLNNSSTIMVTGAVDDIRPFLQRATISVAPLRYGAGIQNKVLEAMACGTPVITSPQGINALNIRIGEDILSEGNKESFAKAIITLLGNPQMRDRVGESGRQYVEKNHDWSVITKRLEEIYIETIHKQFRSS